MTEFHKAEWEPYQAKLAIHTTSKKIIQAGEANFSNDLSRKIVDIYQIKSDSELGFIVKSIGTIGSEKVLDVYFSGVGNVLCTIDQELGDRSTLNFFMI